MEGAGGKRYEHIYRRITQRARMSFYLCVAVSALMAAITGLLLGLLGDEVLPGSPHLVRFVVFFVPAFVLLSGVSSVAQLLYLGRQHSRAIEVLNAWTLAEGPAYVRTANRKVPRIGNRRSAMRWLATGQGRGTRFRARMLIYAGDYPEAAQAIEELPAETAVDAFYREMLRQELSFAATGTLELAQLRSMLGVIPDGHDRSAARAALAIQEARLADADGQPWLPSLLAARAEIEPLPPGASIGDRIRATWMVSGLPTVVVIGFLVWISLPD